MDMNPSFKLDDDGIHFEFTHQCKSRVDTSILPNAYDAGSWKVVQQEPLTVTPSINCTECGTHGFITEGKWVKA